MNLSIIEIEKIHKEKFSVPIQILLDPDANSSQALKVLKSLRLPTSYARKVDSRSLIKSDLLIHFPSMVLIADGRVKKRIPGYNGIKTIKGIIAREFRNE